MKASLNFDSTAHNMNANRIELCYSIALTKFESFFYNVYRHLSTKR